MEPEKEGISELVWAFRILVLALSGMIVVVVLVVFWAGGFWRTLSEQKQRTIARDPPAQEDPEFWTAPAFESVTDPARKKELVYGRELIAHTARYLGPEGSVMKVSNGMNCQNCHLDAGTKTFGNNYGAVASTYPKFRARSGTVESVERRVNDCFERSLNGQSLDTSSREMKAIVYYLHWLGEGVPDRKAPAGSGLVKIKLLDRAADPMNGKHLYEGQCVTCHGVAGQGLKNPGDAEYQYPPLWGENSYNQGAGLYRLSTFAQFIVANMPLGATHQHRVLSEEQAWDIAAYVNSLPRPAKDLSRDWPEIERKPFDHPFGPYADPFGAMQHKYGPFGPIQEYYEARARTGER